MADGRGSKAASSLLFKLAESTGMQVISFVVSLLLARLLTPGDYGVLTTLTVFIAISQVFVQSGMSTALIQKKDVDDTDLSSVFFFSLGIAGGLYALLYAAAPAIAAYFEAEQLRDTLRVLALVLFPGAFTCVQNAVVARQMAFRKQMLCSLTATVLSGVTGVTMALGGLGSWALVGQQLVNQVVLAGLMLVFLPWKPKLLFQWNRLMVLVKFGWKLLLSSLLDTGYTHLRSIVIGKRYTQDMLGFYTRGKQFPELVMNAVGGSMSSVMLPVMAEQQDEKEQMKQTLRRAIMASSFLVMPLMAGMAGAAKPMITLLLSEKWLPCVPFLQIMALDYALYPFHMMNLACINANGRSDIFLRLEFIKKAYGLAILAISVFCFDSVEAIAWGLTISAPISAYVNAAPNSRLVGYRFSEQVKDLLPIIALSAVMFLTVSAMNLLALHPALLLILQLITGIAVYGGLALLFKMESITFLMDMLRQLLKKHS